MRTGRLKNKIEIQSPVEEKDSVGEVSIIRWETILTRMAAKESFRSSEFLEFGQIQTETRDLFVMRYPRGVIVTSKMRILSDDLYYEIQGKPIDPDNRHKELLITTIEKSYDQS